MNGNTLAQASRAAILAGVAFGVAACGGGGGSVGGIDRLGVSSGQVTGFGSIYVNGVEWETSGADIIIDDSPGTESDLRVGQVVTVRGELGPSGTTGRADTIEFDNSLEGPIASIDGAAGTFVVLGQTVITSADTRFDDSITDPLVDGSRTLADLTAGVFVEVSGYRDAQGAVRATRIEERATRAEVEVKGVVTGLDSGDSTFGLGALTVSFAGAMLEDFDGPIANGDYVEVEGTLSGGTLDADKVELEDDFGGDDGDAGNLEGLVTSFLSTTNFQVNGIAVTTDGGTQYERGTSADLAANIKVEVKGEFNGAGVLVADKIEFRIQGQDANVEIAGIVGTVNPAAGTFTVEGLEVLVRADGGTRLEDDSDDDDNGNGSFTLAELQQGDYVEVRGAEDGSTPAVDDVLAIRIERDDDDEEIVLRGPVQAESEPDLTILGVTVDTISAVFRDQGGNTISEAEFFLAIGIGDVVKATAEDSLAAFGGTLDAEEVEIEDDEDDD